MSLSVPVALFIFRRPQTTKRVLAAIAQAKPRILFVVADGPRTEQEARLCADTRAVIQNIDWDCKVITNYSDTNLGLKQRVPSGLDWVFEQVEEAIILEDDCVPDPTFFPFCSELLEKYANNPQVMMISGQSFSHDPTPYSYYFSRFPFIWGWATWRRAWRNYDGTMSKWGELRDTDWLHTILEDDAIAQHWQSLLDMMVTNDIDAWGYRWIFSCWLHDGLTVLPSKNLVSNIGFGRDAIHTKDSHSKLANITTAEMSFPLQHPPVVHDIAADQDTFQQLRILEQRSLSSRVYAKLISLVKLVQR